MDRSDRCLEPPQLLGDAAARVGVREMAHQRDARGRRRARESLEHLAVALGGETEPVHARVHLEVHRYACGQPGGFEHRDLLVVMDDDREAVLAHDLQVVGLEHPFEQQDRLDDSRIAQPHCLVEIEQREPVGSVELADRPLEPMTVGVRLYDCPDARARRTGAGKREVAAERSGVEDGADRTRHRLQISTLRALKPPRP